jgi:hypothetical protein
MSYRERIERTEKVERGLRTAATWARKGGWFAIDDTASDWEVERFLSSVLDAVEMVVNQRPPKAYYHSDGGTMLGFDLGPPGDHQNPDFEMLLASAEKIVGMLRAEQDKGKRGARDGKLRALIDHPGTGEHERASAVQMLNKLKAAADRDSP